MLEDYEDQEEHRSGNLLLSFLEKEGINNHAIYVARIYNGTHIGGKRLEAILDAAKSALIHGPFNCVTKEHQQAKKNLSVCDILMGRRQQSYSNASIRGGHGWRPQHQGHREYSDWAEET